MSDIVERLRSNQPLPICPYDQKSPEYWTTPDDAPCKFCGGLPDGPDKCTGADTRIMGEAADDIERLRKALEFYADKKNWNDCRFDNDEPGVLTLVPSTVDADNGKIARAALDAIKEG